MAGVDEYSTTPASNTSIAGITVSDATDPSAVDNIVRQLMADVRRFANDIGAKAVSAGTDTITLTTETILATAYADGTMLGFIAGGTNTGAATLNVDGVGAKAIRKGADVALAAGDIVAGQVCVVVYDASANSADGAWLLVNPSLLALGGVYQPLDSDLTAIAALTTTAYGRGLLELANVLALKNQVFPVGMVVPYAGATAPTNWLLCFGQEVARADFAALDAVIGETYGAYTDGAGEAGSTHLVLPDLRGRVVAGKDNMGGVAANRLTEVVTGTQLGDTGGSEFHTLTVAELPEHTHGFKQALRGGGANNALTEAGADVSSGAAGDGDPHRNVQPTIILNYIIYTGV